jgi:hypothetical protein
MTKGVLASMPVMQESTHLELNYFQDLLFFGVELSERWQNLVANIEGIFNKFSSGSSSSYAEEALF